jgi:hypothetical protein
MIEELGAAFVIGGRGNFASERNARFAAPSTARAKPVKTARRQAR